MIKKSIKHLKDNNMSYYEHIKFAGKHGLSCVKAGIFLIIHGLIPALFPRAGSKLVNKLNKNFTEHNEILQKCKRCIKDENQ